jgi:hypothetical protein
LKKPLQLDKVAVMSRCARLTSPLLAKLTWWRSHDAAPASKPSSSHDPILLSSNDVEALERIVDQWAEGMTNNRNEIIDIALRRLQRDLDSGFMDEVIEDVQQEIDYRLWCVRNSL